MRLLIPTLLVLLTGLQPAYAEDLPTMFGKTVDGWIEVLRDKASTASDRSSAVHALAYFGPAARAAAPDLIREVRPGGSFVDPAIRSLVAIGAGSEVTVPYLIERFVKGGCDNNASSMESTTDAWIWKPPLVEIGEPAVPALLALMEGPDEEMRACAADHLGWIGPAAKGAVPALLRAIEHPGPGPHNSRLREQAVFALGRIGPGASAAIPTLNRLLNEKPDNEFFYGIEKFDVVLALDRIGAPPFKHLIDSFLREPDSGDDNELAWLGPKAHEAAPDLLGALADKRPQVRFDSAIALAHVDPSATEAIPVLIEALDFCHDEDESVDVNGVSRALARFGPKAQAALPKLISFVKKGLFDEDDLKALVQIDPDGEACVPALLLALKDDTYQHVSTAARCLGLLGPKAKNAVPALAVALARRSGDEFSEGYLSHEDVGEALGRVV